MTMTQVNATNQTFNPPCNNCTLIDSQITPVDEKRLIDKGMVKMKNVGYIFPGVNISEVDA